MIGNAHALAPPVARALHGPHAARRPNLRLPSWASHTRSRPRLSRTASLLGCKKSASRTSLPIEPLQQQQVHRRIGVTGDRMTDVRILTVSDDPALRAAVDTALRAAGYRASRSRRRKPWASPTSGNPRPSSWTHAPPPRAPRSCASTCAASPAPRRSRSCCGAIARPRRGLRCSRPIRASSCSLGAGPRRGGRRLAAPRCARA